MAYCTRCGKKLFEGSVFCYSCGAKAAPATLPPYSPPNNRPVYREPQPPRKSSGATFLNTGLGFVLIGVLLIAVQVLFFSTPMAISQGNIRNVFLHFALLVSLAFGSVLAVRAKGPDLSIGAVTALSGIIISLVVQSGGSWFVGLLLAIVAAAAIGAVNGLINALMPVQSAGLSVFISAVVTFVASFVVRQLAGALSGGSRTAVDLPAMELVLPFMILLLVSFILAFFLNFGTKLGTPVYSNKRPVGLCIGAYITSAVIAALVGFCFLIRLRVASPTMGSGYEIYILFVFACIMSSRALDNRAAPVLFALMPAVIWSLLNNAFLLQGLPTYSQDIIFIILTVIILAAAFISHHQKKDKSNEALGS